MFDYKTSGTCSRMIHIDSDGGGTSCPDQLAKALLKMQAQGK